MNINSISQALQTNFIESALDSFTSSQKKVMVVALGIFSAVALAYYFYRFCNFKATSLAADKSRETDDKVQSEEEPEETEEPTEGSPVAEDTSNLKTATTDNCFTIVLNDGRTRKVYKDGTIEVGHFKNGKLEGQGLCLFPDPNSQDATELDQLEPYPKGHKDIKSIQGLMKDGKLQSGELIFHNRRFYSGDFINGQLVKGVKKYHDSDDVLDYEKGEFVNDQLNGMGRVRLKDGKISQGIFQAGVLKREIRDLNIVCKTLTGKEFPISTSLDEKVEIVRQKIQDREGIPPDQQRLIYAGEQLEDGQILEGYDIEPHSTIHIVLRLGGD
jgi:hypothetical protein